MIDYRDVDERDTEVQRDENGMIILSSERRVEPPPKSGGLAGVIFAAALVATGVGGYFWMQNAPQEPEIAAIEEPMPVQRQQLALNDAQPAAEAPIPPAATAAPAQRQAAPRASASPPSQQRMPEPVPDTVPPIAPQTDPMAPPPALDLNTPPTGE
ncbi:hypothetical protein U91I_01098 [alpha proteobacterium U9-1i]|nr:hypothetical protein U91I_01098 [alpha proteobacterium U9-1i]